MRRAGDLNVLNPVATYWFRPDSYVTVEYERTNKSINGYKRALPYHPMMDFQTMGFPIDHSWNTHAAGDYMSGGAVGRASARRLGIEDEIGRRAEARPTQDTRERASVTPKR